MHTGTGDTATKLAQDFEVLPALKAKEDFSEAILVWLQICLSQVMFGEGEVKIYLDDDKEYPSLNGTGTED
jgi:hypothetical protein